MITTGDSTLIEPATISPLALEVIIVILLLFNLFDLIIILLRYLISFSLRSGL